jgi:CRP-like cAMP-binding protein
VYEGEKADAFYVIERGVCDVLKILDVNGKKNEVV